MVNFRTPILNEAIDDIINIRTDVLGGLIAAPRDRVGLVIEALSRETDALVERKARTAIEMLTHLRGEMMRVGEMSAEEYSAHISKPDGNHVHPAEFLSRVIAELSRDEEVMTAVFIVTKHEYFNPSSVQVIMRPAASFPADTNGQFWSASPYTGEVKLNVSNLVAQRFFKSGQQYALTFTDLHCFGGTAAEKP